MEIGQDVHMMGGSVEDAVNEGVRLRYTGGFLRKSVVRDRLNGSIPGKQYSGTLFVTILFRRKGQITATPKGFGSENMESRLHAKAHGRYRRC